ncbi:hypothetical protein L226DRAFT_540753 [Lentinus tigrinus ALCF2SS1-7]|uniref:uncharacterized protein n=1 Tax=Lentinus tigrinus ALCF2SS1-7 TaxID=1328758 RepID=UPI0011661ADB|nr:hypothetical protein L226DRAFT_540753 [Lentinus tigrinus ALCF2SS1-7]
MGGLEDAVAVFTCIQSLTGRLVAAISVSKDLALEYRIWHIVNFASTPEMHQLTAPSIFPSSATFLGDDQLVIGYPDGTIEWWDLSSFPLPTTEPHGTLTVYPEGDQDVEIKLLSASPLGTFLVAWNPRNSTVPVLRHPGRMNFDLCPGQSHAASRSDCVHICLEGPIQQAGDVCFSPCEQYIVTVVGAQDSKLETVRLWSAVDGSLIWRFTEDWMGTHIVFSTDGRTLALGDANGQVCLYPVSRFVRSDTRLAPLTV